MARIANVTLPNDKQLETALTYIHGVGRGASQQIIKKAKLEASIRVKDLSETQIQTISKIVSADYVIEGELKRLVFNHIKRLKDIRSYRGLRHNAKLPTRGQRTKTNARTRRGKKITVGGTKKKTPTKT